VAGKEGEEKVVVVLLFQRGESSGMRQKKVNVALKQKRRRYPTRACSREKRKREERPQLCFSKKSAVLKSICSSFQMCAGNVEGKEKKYPPLTFGKSLSSY